MIKQGIELLAVNVATTREVSENPALGNMEPRSHQQSPGSHLVFVLTRRALHPGGRAVGEDGAHGQLGGTRLQFSIPIDLPAPDHHAVPPGERGVAARHQDPDGSQKRWTLKGCEGERPTWSRKNMRKTKNGLPDLWKTTIQSVGDWT